MKVCCLKVAKTFLWLVWLSSMALSQTSRAVTPARATARNGNLTAVKKTTGARANLDAITAEGLTLLQDAVLNEGVARVQALLRQGADPNAANRAGVTPLMLAVGDTAKLKLLLAAGANVNAVSAERRSALIMAAAQKRALAPVSLLLRHGAQVNQRDRRGGTALLKAARNGDVATLRLLLARGADPQVRLIEGEVPPEDGANALDLACYSQNAAAVQLLLAHRVCLDKGGRPLVFAAMNGSLDIVQLLLAAGAPVNVADPLGYTPLMHAALTENGNLALLRLLLERGADPNAKAKDGNTASDIARRKGWTDALALLQPAGAGE